MIKRVINTNASEIKTNESIWYSWYVCITPRRPQFVNIYWLTIKCISRPGAAGACGSNNPAPVVMRPELRASSVKHWWCWHNLWWLVKRNFHYWVTDPGQVLYSILISHPEAEDQVTNITKRKIKYFVRNIKSSNIESCDNWHVRSGDDITTRRLMSGYFERPRKLSTVTAGLLLVWRVDPTTTMPLSPGWCPKYNKAFLPE